MGAGSRLAQMGLTDGLILQQILDALNDLRAEQQVIRRLLVEGLDTRPIAAVRGTDERLLLAVAEFVEETAFSVAEVIAHAALVGPLREALDAAGATNGRKLGKLFRRLEGGPVAGVRLVRIGVDRDGLVWRVSRV